MAPKVLVDFINKEGNILLALSGESSTPSALQSFLLELDIVLPSDKTSITVDHFNYDTLSSSDKHDVLLLSQPLPSRPDVKNFFGGAGQIAFPHAVAQTLENSSPLVNSILKAKKTAYTYNPKEDTEFVEDPFATGKQISLVSSIQARNSARFTVFGSSEALQNKWFDANVKGATGDKIKTANREFAKKVTQWAFKETGVLKVGKVQHHLSEITETTHNKSIEKVGSLNPTIYRIKNDVVSSTYPISQPLLMSQTFNIELSEYTGTHYAPPVFSPDDALQLEFTMLSPWHRLDLKPSAKTQNSTIYSTTFTTPDQHGIFSFRVNHKRPFFTSVEVKEEVTVRHFAHDEYPRSWTISGGWVWIAGIWVTVAGWLVFVALWLYSEPVDEKSKAKKKQ